MGTVGNEQPDAPGREPVGVAASRPAAVVLAVVAVASIAATIAIARSGSPGAGQEALSAAERIACARQIVVADVVRIRREGPRIRVDLEVQQWIKPRGDRPRRLTLHNLPRPGRDALKWHEGARYLLFVPAAPARLGVGMVRQDLRAQVRAVRQEMPEGRATECEHPERIARGL